jgi:glyoxalase family protein
MRLEGLHHVTAICADAQRNVDFYAGVLGLRLVKKTVNFDAPDVYHLYYGDESGTPGSIMTFFEFPGARRGRAGDGMVHTVCWRVGSVAALDFWERRLAAAGVEGLDRGGRALRFADPEGLRLALMVNDEVADAPLTAAAEGVPPEHAIRGFHGVRAYASDPSTADAVLDALGMEQDQPGRWVAAGASRRGQVKWDAPPGAPGIQGAGTVHHVAWSAADDEELEAFRRRVAAAGARPTTIVDRQYFHSVYFRVPTGVLFELATRDIGFAVDEPAATLGAALKLPPQHEHLRERLEATLAPLVTP